jgi:hypothetical protein
MQQRRQRFFFSSQWVWWLLSTSLPMTTTDAFVPHRGRWNHIVVRGQRTSLFYQNNSTTDASSSSSQSSKNLVEIPVIGPLLNAPPLIIGGTLWLSPPTPLQWKTIEICVEAQHSALLKSNANNNTETVATVDAAPLVAILQEGGGNYVTIAAIEGIVAESQTIDTSDPISFRESLAGFCSPYYSESSRIRLVGIGIATLSGFTTKEDVDDKPRRIQEHDDEDTDDTALTSSEDGGAVVVVYEEEEEDDECPVLEEEDPVLREPVVMARMKLLMDGTDISDKEYGTKSSPVRALSQLSMWASRIRFLHQDRQKRVQGLQTAHTRIDMASQEWQDWDDIGTLFEDERSAKEEARKGETTTHIDPNEEYQRKINNLLKTFTGEHSRPLTPEAASLVQMDNYGLGTTPSAYSDLQALTKVLMEKLQPYYSPQLVQTEEFEYSIFSWVALQSLQAFLEPKEVQMAMESTSTSERLEQVYHAMMRHKDALQELAQAKSQELQDCGEECTDLF